MFLAVGLGNPGPKYSGTRHNVGFMVLDHWARSEAVSSEKDEHKSKTAKIKVGDTEVLIAKPLTFMNLSGEAVSKLLSYYKIPLQNLIVIHDDVDVAFGTIKIQKNRGPAGNNGLKSINEQLGTQDYVRIKFGVGRPPHPEMATADYVLQKFSDKEFESMNQLMDHCVGAIKSFALNGFEKAASGFSKKVIDLTPPSES
jgi:PTH1 family peptidyl-tRNA hydrolase